ncbi:hypothetical protein [Candidatus Nitrospira allomarina]|uniref:Blue (type 1) copper domain-containing protein n=1 Tax=Candidatus Nitrospira allomarina TaxID=3020900 RepID=A0AA96GAQ3_9BACT|nr:hypothetical protein [Candidatus Nitrospira allomarina]WNM58071.1 hypothetical protein PP769_19200 [Candidatus Nitrospira allomarina]
MKNFNFNNLKFLLIGTLVLAMAFPVLAAVWPTTTIVVKDNGYHITSESPSGTLTPGFTMDAGMTNTITLKNEDMTPHEFVSKSFKHMDVEMSGEADVVKDGAASGWKIKPGKTVVLKVTPKVGENFGGSWEVFYCPIHGKGSMRGEVVVADSRTGTGAF